MQEEHSAENVFGPIAGIYDEVRPSYPAELIADLLNWSNLPDQGRILEIGCGTGKATRLVLPYGHAVTCIDPSAGMLAVARQTTSGFTNVEFHEPKLEDWTLPDEPFDLAFSAQAFHWIDPVTGFKQIAKALRHGGTFAIIWSSADRSRTPLRDEFDKAYGKFASDLKTPSPGVVGDSVTELVNTSGLFGGIEYREYEWVDEYDADSWVKFLTTTSDHRVLPVDRREQLLAAVHGAITTHGGVHRFGVTSKLLMCRKA